MQMTIDQNLFKDKWKKNKKGKKMIGKSFVLHHCYAELGNEEKWKTRDKMGVHTKGMNATAEAATIIDDDASSDDKNKRSSTPHSLANTRRPFLGKKAAKEMSGRKDGDDDLAKATEAMVTTRQQANVDRKVAS
jgi:hypothetical protein